MTETSIIGKNWQEIKEKYNHMYNNKLLSLFVHDICRNIGHDLEHWDVGISWNTQAEM